MSSTSSTNQRSCSTPFAPSNENPGSANDQVHQLLCQIWRDCTAWLVGRYVIMPDHIHFFATDSAIDIAYDDWVKYWQFQFTKRHRHPDHVWQTDHWDTRMRTATAYENKWHYVRHNPVRHNLVTTPDAWPYQGQIHNIHW